MKRSVAIVGTGWVGSSIAISTLHSGVADELLLNDLRMEVAEGDAMDLAQGASFYPPATVRAVALDEIATADVVVVTAGRGGRPNESRLELLRDNAAIVEQVGAALKHYRGTVLEPVMDDEERAALERSAEVLRAAAAPVQRA